MNRAATYQLGYEVFGDIGDCCCDTIVSRCESLTEGQNVFCDCGTSFKSVQVDKQEATPTTVQSLIFSKSRFKDATDAKEWAKENGFKATKVHETEESFRLRQRSPGSFVKDSFKTITLTRGVKAVIGHLKKKERMDPNSINKVTSIDHKGITKESSGHTHSYDLYVTLGQDGKPLNGYYGSTSATSDGSEHYHEIRDVQKTEPGGDDSHTYDISLPITIVVKEGESGELKTEEGVLTGNNDKPSTESPGVREDLRSLFSARKSKDELEVLEVNK